MEKTIPVKITVNGFRSNKGRAKLWIFDSEIKWQKNNSRFDQQADTDALQVLKAPHLRHFHDLKSAGKHLTPDTPYGSPHICRHNVPKKLHQIFLL